METQDISKNPGNGNILIYQSEDGRILMSEWNKRLCGSHNNSCASYTRPVNQTSASMSSIFSRTVSWTSFQLFGNSEQPLHVTYIHRGNRADSTY